MDHPARRSKVGEVQAPLAGELEIRCRHLVQQDPHVFLLHYSGFSNEYCPQGVLSLYQARALCVAQSELATLLIHQTAYACVITDAARAGRPAGGIQE